jgi:protocatechuate 3,4-dioxygenase beta subunit
LTRTLAFAVVLVVVSTAPGAQTPIRDGAPPAVPAGSGALAGMVRDDLNRLIRRATVAINGDMRLQRSTITDDEGRFSFSNLPAGRFTITVSKPGYPTMSYGAQRPNRPGAGVLVGDGQQIQNIVVTLPRGAVLSGTVFDPHGQPMPGIPVMPWEVRTSLTGERTLLFPSTGGNATTSDDRGEFRFFGLPPGEYTVGTAWFYNGMAGNIRVPSDAEIRAAFQASSGRGGIAPPAPQPVAPPMRSGSARAIGSHNYSKVFHPGSIDPMAATTVMVKAGEERAGMDIQMQFRPMSHLNITVAGPADLPPARLQIARMSKVDALNSIMNTMIPVNGQFESSSLSPDRYLVRVQSSAFKDKPAMWAASEVVLEDPEPVNLALQLQAGMVATGRLAFESAAGRTLPAPANVSVSLSATSPGGWGALSSTTVDPSFRFTRDGVFPGTFRLTASVIGVGAADWTMKSATLAGRDVTDRPFDIHPGDSPAFVVTFTDQTTELSGSLLDPSGRPSPDHFVVVIPADPVYWLPASRRIASTRPDVNGRYVFRTLPPGEYRLAATTDLVSQDLQQRPALEALAAQSLAFTIGAGEKKIVDVRVAGR